MAKISQTVSQTPPLKSDKNWVYSGILITLIASCGLLAYSNTLNNFFLSDDLVLIALFSKLGPLGLWVNHQHGQSLFFRPVLSLISYVDYQIWGTHPLGYHLTNLLFHFLNTVCVGLITFFLSQSLRIDRVYKILLPYLAAFIFLLLPTHTEVVSWISARTDDISTFFGLFSFTIYLAYKYYQKPLYLIISAASFLCALLSKEAVVSYPGIILLYELYEWGLKRNQRNTLAARFSIFSLFIWTLIFYLCIRYIKIGELVGGYGEEIHLKIDWTHILQNIVIYPTRSFLTPQPNWDFQFWLIAFMGLILLFLICTTVCLLHQPSYSDVPKLLIFLLGAFYTLILPAITVFVSTVDTQGERYLYFASAFMAIFIALILTFILIKIKLILVISSGLLVFLGLSLFSLNQNWQIASEISKDILFSVKNLPNDSIIINSLPDNYRGAYIYRTGLIQGLYLFDPENKFEIELERQPTDKNFERVQFKTDKVRVVMNHNLWEKMDQILVDNPAPGLYQFKLSNPQAEFFAWKKNPLVTEDYEVKSVQLNQYELQFTNLTKTDDLVFYSPTKLVVKMPSRND